MDFIYLLAAILGIFILWKIFSFVFKNGNWHLIPTNITRAYKTIRDKFKDGYSDNTELLFIAGIVNAIMYIKKDSNLIGKIYSAAKSCDSIQDETGMVSDFSQILMQEYFLQDSKMDTSEIATTIYAKRHDIDKSVSQELESEKYNTHIGENIIAIAKEHYSNFEKNKVDN